MKNLNEQIEIFVYLIGKPGLYQSQASNMAHVEAVVTFSCWSLGGEGWTSISCVYVHLIILTQRALMQ